METTIPSMRTPILGIEARWWIIGCSSLIVLVCCLCLCLAVAAVAYLQPARSPTISTPVPPRPLLPLPTPRRPASSSAAPVVDQPAPDFVLNALDEAIPFKQVKQAVAETGRRGAK